MANKELVRFRIRPYALEATLQLTLDVFLMVLATALYLWIGVFPPIVYIGTYVAYFIIALLLHYRVFLLAITDNIKGDYVTETVNIKAFAEEYSFAGDRLGHSYVRLFWPKEMDVQRYKILVTDHGEKQKKIRTVMSSYRFGKFRALNLQQAEHLRVTYLKRSKILVYVEPAEEIVDGKRKGKAETKRKTEIEKAIRAINRSV